MISRKIIAFLFLLTFFGSINAQSARDKLVGQIETTSAEMTKEISAIKAEYKDAKSETSLFVLENIGFETDENDICQVAFLQKETAEDRGRVRNILYTLDMGDVDVDQKWTSRNSSIITIPMLKRKKVLAEAFVNDRKKKERKLEAFDIASPEEPQKLIGLLKRLNNYCSEN